MLSHFQQKSNVCCGAACYRILLSDKEIISEKQAVDEVLTTNNGTKTSDVINALNKRGINNFLVQINIPYTEFFPWLNLNSQGRKIYLSGEFHDKTRTKDKIRHHALVASNGFIYDPAEKEIYPIDCYFHTFSKSLIIKEMIIIFYN